MKHALDLQIEAQPDLETCGPTCLHALYRFHGRDEPLEAVIDRVRRVESGGTIAPYLAMDALDRGFDVTIHTFNLAIFDPTWFVPQRRDVAERLVAQRSARPRAARELEAIDAYIDFARRGGRIEWGDLTPDLLRGRLAAEHPILTGLSSTYLYQESREDPETGDPDDVGGTPGGHFVVLTGIDPSSGRVRIADPLGEHGEREQQTYDVSLERTVCAILLGVLTYDANLMSIVPKEPDPGSGPA